MRLNAAIDQPPRHDAEALRIEIAEIDDIDCHGRNLSCRIVARHPRPPSFPKSRITVNGLFYPVTALC
jgi:hypothetical protein